MLHSAIFVTTSDVIQGHGLKPSELLVAGTVVWQLDPDEPTYTLQDIGTWPREKQIDFFTHGYQCGEHEFAYSHDIDRYTNHSCDPNLWWSSDGSLTLIASRDIQPGEEITYDYTTGDILLDYQMECTCGSSRCRKVITNNDYLDHTWQQYYGSHVPPHVLLAIAKAKSDIL